MSPLSVIVAGVKLASAALVALGFAAVIFAADAYLAFP